MKESELQRKMIEILRNKGCYVINNHGSLYSSNGVADLTVSFGGRFIACELKTPIGKVSPMQVKHLKSCADSGAYAYVINNLEDIDRMLRGDGDVYSVHGDMRTNEALLDNSKTLTKQLKQSGLVRIK